MSVHTRVEIDRLASSACGSLPGTFPDAAQSHRSDAAPRRRGGWLKLREWLRAWRERETLRAELQQLSPRDLADLGISRADFPAIIAGTFTQDGEDFDTDRR